MKFTVILLLFIVFFNVNAGATDPKIGKACLQHAVSLVNQLKSDVFAGMDDAQSNEVLRLVTGNCNKHFSNIKAGQVVVNTTAGKTGTTAGAEEDGSDDWFTERILRGEPADKKGNRRLKRLQHK